MVGAKPRVGLTFPFEPGGVWFVLEALDPMPDVTLMEAGKELTHGLRLLSPGYAVEVCLLTKSWSTFQSLNDFI